MLFTVSQVSEDNFSSRLPIIDDQRLAAAQPISAQLAADWPIRGQHSGHVTSIDQSEASILAAAAARPVFVLEWALHHPDNRLSLMRSQHHTQGVNNNKRTTCRRGQEKLHQVRRKLDFLFNTDIVISTVELWTIGQYNRKRNRILRPVSGQCCLHYPGFTRHYRQSLLNRDNEDKDV